MSTVTIELPEEIVRGYGQTNTESARLIGLQLAIDKYRDGVWSIGKSAQAVGMSLWEFMVVLKERKAEMPYTKEMVDEDFAYARSRL